MENEKMSKQHMLVLLSCCVFFGTAVGLAGNCMGQFVRPISQSLGVKIGSVTLFITIISLSSAFFGPTLNKLLEKYNIKLILSIAIIGNALCLALCSMLKSIYLFYAMAILMGIFNISFGTIPVTILLNNWFVKNIGMYTGLVSSLSGIVGAIFNPIVAGWINSLGYQTTFIICGVIIVVTALPCALFFVRLKPEDVGLLPYGLSKPINPKGDMPLNLESNKTFPTAIVTYIFVFVIFMQLNAGLNPNLAAFAQSVPLKPAIATSIVSAAMIGNVGFKFLFGMLVDKFGAKKAIGTMFIISSIGLIMMSTLTPESGIIALICTVLYGAVFSVTASGMALLMREIYGPTNFSKYFSTGSVFTSCSYAASVSIVGFSYDILGTYKVAILFFAILELALVGALVVLGRMQKKYRL